MTKAVSLKILKLHYGGDSIGNDIRLEIEVAGEKIFSYTQTIKKGSTFEYNQEVKQFKGVNGFLEVPLKFIVTEKDWLWSDVGETNGKIQIDPNVLPQTFDFQVTVQEKNRLTRSKSTAIFTLTLEAKEFNPIYPRPRPYINLSKKDYNRFDTEIAEAVGNWNDEFLNQEYPPYTPLDPSLVKAMVYAESEFGYYIRRKTARNPHPYPSYPDVMQVADPDNDAIYALQNVYNPKKHKMGTEYEIVYGKEVLFYHPEANAVTAQQSIYWGVRWLYKKAQKNVKTSAGLVREWKDWKQAVHDYNGEGDPQYVDKVYQAYEKGVGENKYPLWSVVLLFLCLVGITPFFFFVDYEKLENSILAFEDRIFAYGQQANIKSADIEDSQSWISPLELREKVLKSHKKDDPEEEIEDIEIGKLYDSQLFFAIIENQKDWWEYFDIGKIGKHDKVTWLEIESWPEGVYMQNSILSARWVELKGFNEPILEVYGITHMGNGSIYLFRVKQDTYDLIFSTFAVDRHYEAHWEPENYKKYSYGTCSEVFQNDKLAVDYSDVNHDGVSDITLSGIMELSCESEEKSKDGPKSEIEISATPIKHTYFLEKKDKCAIPTPLFFYNCYN